MKYIFLSSIAICVYTISNAQLNLEKKAYSFQNEGQLKTQALKPLKDTILNGLVFPLPQNKKATYYFENEVNKRYELPPVQLRVYIPYNDPNTLNQRGSMPEDTIIVNGKDVYASNIPNSKFLFENEKAKVYQLPLDNMRCLVPNFNSNMPVFKGLSPELNPSPKIVPVPIPNPFYKDGIKSPEVKRIPIKPGN